MNSFLHLHHLMVLRGNHRHWLNILLTSSQLITVCIVLELYESRLQRCHWPTFIYNSFIIYYPINRNVLLVSTDKAYFDIFIYCVCIDICVGRFLPFVIRNDEKFCESCFPTNNEPTAWTVKRDLLLRICHSL